MILFLLICFAYLLGSVPFGLLLGRVFADVDVRDFGSGNIGATNVNRVLGRKLGAITLLADVVKGLIPVLFAKIFGMDLLSQLLVGIAAFLGHIFPIYLKFQGGKGVATAFGILVPIVPVPALSGLVAWLVAAKVSKISAVGALAACVVIPLVSIFTVQNWKISLLLIAMMVLIVIRHKENIQQLKKAKSSP